MTSFVAIYRGESLSDAKMIAVSANGALVARVASEMLGDRFCHDDSDDSVLAAITLGRRQALRLVKTEADGDA